MRYGESLREALKRDDLGKIRLFASRLLAELPDRTYILYAQAEMQSQVDFLVEEEIAIQDCEYLGENAPDRNSEVRDEWVKRVTAKILADETLMDRLHAVLDTKAGELAYEMDETVTDTVRATIDETVADEGLLTEAIAVVAAGANA